MIIPWRSGFGILHKIKHLVSTELELNGTEKEEEEEEKEN